MAYIYESVFMARQDLTEAQVEKLTEQFSKIITDHKGKIIKTEYWGLRNLAYVINKAKKAHYTLIEFEVDGGAVQEYERIMRLNEDVMRFMTVRLEKPSETVSAILRKAHEYTDNNENEKEAA